MFHWQQRRNSMVSQGINPLVRWSFAILAASFATFVVFWMMQTLISSGNSVVNEEGAGRLVEFVDVSQDEDVQTKQRKVNKPPAPPVEPPKPDLPKPSVQAQAANAFDLGAIDLSADLNIDAGLMGSGGDGDFLPIVKVAPQYPRRALQKGIEGHVTVEFTVTALGTVIDPKVIGSNPPNIFNRAAINAVIKFKYKPKIVDGKAQAVTGVRNIIRFELDKSSK
ncbi:MAG: protein TonB [Oleispira sp.]|jgi:protein TonB